MSDQLQKWQALSSRIQGFIEAFKIWSAMDSKLSSGIQGRQFLSWVRDIFTDLDSFKNEFAQILSNGKEYFPYFDRLKSISAIDTNSLTSDALQAHIAEASLIIAQIKNIIDYQLVDKDIKLKNLTERAFLHLQWSIYSDNNTRDSWKKAFESGETACEKIGACHLLLHGIYAFKAHAKAITDLVLGDKIDPQDAASSEGLVLTEWKLLKEVNKIKEVALAAEEQSEQYGDGPLGVTYLRTVRYIILVTEKKILVPPDTQKKSHLYRHINISVDPDSPSISGPKLAKKTEKE